MDSTESPKSLYALSLRQVVHRLNRLCNYVKVGRHLDDQLLFLSEKGDKTGLFFSPPPADILVCFEHHHPSSSRQVQRLSFNHHNEGDQNLEEGEEGEEDVVKRNSPFCDEFSSSSSSSRSFLHGGRSSSSSSNGIGNLDANSIDNNAKLLKNRMKKSYHSLLNTFIFGGGSSSSSGNSSKKPPMSPNGSLASSSFSSSSSSNSFSNSSSSENSPPSEQDRLRASYRVAADLVEDIFNEYQRRYPLTDRSLKLAIFGGSVNRFRRVEIKEAGQLTTGGLSMLAGHHQLTSLSVAHLNSASVSINELISCLAPVTAAQHLTSLSVRHCSFSGSRPYNSGCSSKAACLVLSIGQLPRLTNLDVSFTDFNNHALEVVAEDLPHLVSLNISSTKVTLLGPIASNRGLVSRLKVLLAHNTSGSCRDEHLLEGLTSLERLDISDSRSYLDTSQNSLNKLLTAFATFPRLVELDLSGRNGVDYHEVEQLVVARQSSSSSNPNQAEVTPLRFLGLLETNLNYDDLLDLMKASAEPITLTGNGNIHHILESLRRYRDCSVFVQKSLLHLYQTRFNLDSEEMLAQRPAIIRLILDLLTTYLSSVNIVLVSTACLYIFTQMNVFAGGGNGSNHPPLHPHLLTKVVKVNMATMTKYATNQPVMKNILLTLCSDRILQEIPFDRMHCMQLVMDSLITFSEPTLNRLALAVCSILAAKIPTEQTTSIGQQVKYMGRLLEFVQRSNAAIDTDNRDVLFKLALSALWNFTDESPKTCQTFIENRGLQLYIEALVLYHGQNSVETKILGLINNIAEVPYLRKDLIDGNLLANLKNLIQSEHIDISYFSAGILSQLASDRSLDWSQLKDFSLPEVLDEMKQVILSWQTPNFEMVAYRSFVPFIALLTCRPHPAVQLWALWAIHHVCTKSGSQKYCQMLYDERCLSLIADILDDRIRAIGRQNGSGGNDCFSSLAQVAFMRGRLVQNATPDCYPSGSDLPFENGNGSGGGSGSRQGSPSRANKDLPQCSFLFSPCVTVPREKEVLKAVEEKEEVLQLMLHRSTTNQLSLFTCDCKLAHYLRRDPFLALPALILHTFAQECPRLVAKDFQF